MLKPPCRGKMRIKMARWWDRLGGRPGDHAASPRIKTALYGTDSYQEVKKAPYVEDIINKGQRKYLEYTNPKELPFAT